MKVLLKTGKTRRHLPSENESSLPILIEVYVKVREKDRDRLEDADRLTSTGMKCCGVEDQETQEGKHEKCDDLKGAA